MDDFWSGTLSFGCIAALGGAAAALLYFCSAARRRWLPLPRLRWGRWSGGEILAVYIVLHLAHAMAAVIMQKIGLVPQSLRKIDFLRIETAAFPLVLFFLFAVLYLVSRTYFNDLGLSSSRWQANCVLGYVAFLLATPVVLGLYVGLQYLTPVVGKPMLHELAEMKNQVHTLLDRSTLIVLVCVAAPITEELLFRGVIQGWLRRASLIGQVTLVAFVWSASVWSAFPANPAQQTANGENKSDETEKATENDVRTFLQNTQWHRVLFTTLLTGGYIVMLRSGVRQGLFLTEADFLPPSDKSADDETDPIAEGTPEQILAAQRWQVHDVRQQRGKLGLTIFGSAMVFALAHGSWPDPIPLFVLGLVLAWLAQRTQNLLPGIVLHSLFNGVAAMILLSSGN